MPGTSASGSGKIKSKFALALIRSNNEKQGFGDLSNYEILEEIPEIDQKELLKFIRKHQPDLVALDNIQEIVKDSAQLLAFAKQLPENTFITQVTGSPTSGFQKLTELAKSKGVLSQNISQKLNPEQTALINAKLALLGVGYKVIVFEDEIKINVSKTRNIGKGGWSAPRYERNMRISINNVKKAMIDYLKEFNIEYDLFNYHRNAVIIIHLNRRAYIKYRNILTRAKKISNELAFAHVSKIPKSSFEYVPLSGSAPGKLLSKNVDSVIVGIDPGTTTGVAILSAKDGNLLTLHSAREYSTSQIIRKISSYGKAVMVCADVNYPPPYTVQKLSRAMGAQLYAPPKRGTARVIKRNLVQDYLDKVKYSTRTDNHQRDALFSAIKGFNSILPKIDRITSLLEKGEKNILVPKLGKILELCLSGITIHDAITIVETELKNSLLRARLTPEKDKGNKVASDLLVISKRQENRLKDLELSLRTEIREKKDLQKENKSLEKQLVEIIKEKQRSETAHSLTFERDKTVQEKMVEIFNLKSEIEELEESLAKSERLVSQLQKIRNIWMRGELIPLKPIEKFHIEAIERTHKDFGIRSGDIVLILDPSGGSTATAKWLIERNIRAIVIPSGYIKRLSNLAKKNLLEAKIPILKEELITYDSEQKLEKMNEKIVRFEEFYIVNKSYLVKRLYEEEVKFVKNKEFLRAKKFKAEQLPEIPVDKNSFEYLLFDYQSQRAAKRLLESGAQQNANNEDD